MQTAGLKYAHLDRPHLKQLTDLEKELHTTIVAMEKPNPLMDLSEEDLDKIRELENSMGVILLAYKEQ